MKAPAFQFYAADFLADENVMVMSLEERGAYITLMCFCWREGSIPAEVDRLAKLCGCQVSAMAEVWQNIQHCFSIDTETQRYRHPRLDAEREKQRENRFKKSLAGREGAKIKHLRSGSANILPEQKDGTCQDSAIAKSSSSSSTSTSSSIKTKHTRGETQPSFQELLREDLGGVQFDELVQLMQRYGIAGGPQDWALARSMWNARPIDLRQKIFDSLNERISAGDDGYKASSPQKYIENHFQRAIKRPVAHTGSVRADIWRDA